MSILFFSPLSQRLLCSFYSLSIAVGYNRDRIPSLPFWFVTLWFYLSSWLPGQCMVILMVHRSLARVGEQMGTTAQWSYMKTASDRAHLSQMHRGDILSQLKRKLDEDPTDFHCRTPLLAPQTFNILPASLYLFPLVSLDGCCSSSALIPTESRGEVQNADWMVPLWGWKASLSNCFWRFTCHILSCFRGLIKCLALWNV